MYILLQFCVVRSGISKWELIPPNLLIYGLSVSFSTSRLLLIFLFGLNPERWDVQWDEFSPSGKPTVVQSETGPIYSVVLLWTRANHSTACDSNWQSNNYTLCGVFQVSCTLPPIKCKTGPLNVLVWEQFICYGSELKYNEHTNP